MQAYTTIKQAAEAEFTEKRSRFISRISPVETEEEAAAFLSRIKSENWDANHNCYSYIIRGNIQKFSDDGEPQGTAGMPILDVLRKEGVTDAIIVVTRYFGGILLGAGGLVRAYSHAAKLALDAAGKREVLPCTVFLIEMPYTLYDKVNKLVTDCGAVTLDSDFGAVVSLKLRLPSSEYPAFAAGLTELTAAVVVPVILSEIFA